MAAPKELYYQKRGEMLVKNLQARHFDAVYCATCEEALKKALELDLPASRELLSRAGYALSRSNMFDVIVEYFILKGVYDVDAINQALFAYDQPLLGSNVG